MPARGDALARAALGFGVVAVAGLGFDTAAAASGPPAHVSIDNVRITGHGRHELIVRVQNAAGSPIEGLERDLVVTLDDHGVGEMKTEYAGAAGPRRLMAVVDATLLRGDAAAMVDDVMRAVARELSPEDRIAVVFAGERPAAKEWSAREMLQAGDRLGPEADAGGPRLLDALRVAAENAASGGRRTSRALLVVTGGEDRGSRTSAEDFLAAARRGGVTSLGVVVLPGARGGALEQLERLAPLTGGEIWSLKSGEPLPPSLGPGVRALLDRYHVTFIDTRWKRDGEPHRLEARAGDVGVGPVGELSYRIQDVYVAGWWAGAWIWIVLAALLVAVVAFLLSRARKQACLLVVQGGEDDGQWFEVFELPLRIGSARENDIVIVRPGVSRSHCVLQRKGGSILLVDSNSEYGSFVNGDRVSRHVLEEDDVIRLGTAIELAYEGR